MHRMLPFLLVMVSLTDLPAEDITRDEVGRMVAYIHDRYRDDYRSMGNRHILDWQKACVAMMYVHAYEVLGDRRYLDWAKDALYVEYNISDDQCWGANALVELARHRVVVAPQAYKDHAGTDHLMTSSYGQIFLHGLTTLPGKAPAPYFGFYDEPTYGGLGGLFWNRACGSYNTCTMGQAIIFAYRIPEATVAGRSPSTFADQWMKLQNELLIDQASGVVFDNYQLRSKDRNKGEYSYNYGTVLGALGLAYHRSRQQHPYAPQTAARVVGHVVNHLTEHGILRSPSADFGNENAHAFNGIFMHFAPLHLFSALPADQRNDLTSLVERSARAVWSQIEEKGKPQDRRYDVSHEWARPFKAGETRCMTTVSGAECLLTYVQMKAGRPPIDYQKR